MKILIPMSGLGKRFKGAGYTSPKPLIRVNGKPIIEHVVSMFPGDHEFIFICNENHLNSTTMRTILESIAPNARILSVPEHDKGPVYATSLATDYINDTDEVVVSYCDYTMGFNIREMLQRVHEGGYAGAVPCYTGFHPHLLHKNLYGGVLRDTQGTMLDYKEKHSFTENPSDSHHSTGTYYFRSGKEFKDYQSELLVSGISINGEQYTSMMYYLYLRDGKKIYVPEVSPFMQWGTPEDLEEFEGWSRYFHGLLGKKKGITDIPVSREALVAIPYPQESETFKKCYNYWESYFTKV